MASLRDKITGWNNPLTQSEQKKDSKRKYPKCVPKAKANSMSKGQIKSAVKRKRASPMKKVKTIVKKKRRT